MANIYSIPQNFSTTLNVGGGITNSQTSSIVLTSVTGLPTDGGILAFDWANPIDTTTIEYIEYTGISGNTLTGVIRGAEGVSAKAHVNGCTVVGVVSQAHIKRLKERIDGTDTTGVAIAKALKSATGSVDTSAATAPTTGQVLTATGSSAATWQTVAAGDWTAYSAVTPTTGTFDAPSYPIVFAGVDLSTTLYPGMRVKITQATVKYFIITKVAFSTDTTVTLYGGTDYTLVASGTTAISAFSYSSAKSPAGFNPDPTKWTETTTSTSDVTQASPTASTWYNLGSLSLSVPIGVWDVYYKTTVQIDKTGVNLEVQTTLSTANNSASDSDLTTDNDMAASGTLTNLLFNVTGNKYLGVTAKTSYFLNAMTPTASVTTLHFRGDVNKTLIRAVNAYL